MTLVTKLEWLNIDKRQGLRSDLKSCMWLNDMIGGINLMPFEKLYNKMLFTWELSQRVKFVQYINGIILKSDFILALGGCGF